jgi:trehalose 6-phosphate synthase
VEFGSMNRLIIVSNRVNPPENQGEAPAGGLAIALTAALREYSGFWFGWSGETTPTFTGELNERTVDGVPTVTVDLEESDYQEYYNGFANGTLWPLFHYRIDLTAYERSFGEGYDRVNRLFAETLAPLLRPGDFVWVHDYHLIPLGRELRRLGVRNPIGFFLHIPWPAAQLVTTLPRHRQLVQALFDYDLVGFQTDEWLSAFEAYVLGEADGSQLDDGRLSAFGRAIRVGAFPIGLDAGEFEALARSPVAERSYDRMAAHAVFRKLIVGVERLDYSKGIEERLLGFERFLQSNPDLHREVLLLQVAPTSRGEVEAYQDLRARIDAQTGRINGLYADVDWAPIRFVSHTYGRDELAGIYRAADVGLVTPLRDGMNLVAKEFVVAQPPEDPGVLVLSRFAGAARQMKEAVIVNPYSAEEMADALKLALAMDRRERIRRWEILMDGVRRFDVKRWRDDFVAALAATQEGRLPLSELPRRTEKIGHAPADLDGDTALPPGPGQPLDLPLKTQLQGHLGAERPAGGAQIGPSALRHPKARREPPAL